MAEYQEKLEGMIERPREYFEHQLSMSEEEKEARVIFFEEFFTKHTGQPQHVAGSRK